MGVAGEVHGERCVEDLKTTFARVDFVTSPPIVQYRETVVPKSSKLRSVESSTPCGNFSISIAAAPFPDDVMESLLAVDNKGEAEVYEKARREILPRCPESKRKH